MYGEWSRLPAADGARTIGYMYLRQSNQKRADGSVLSHLQIAENVWDPVKKPRASASSITAGAATTPRPPNG